MALPRKMHFMAKSELFSTKVGSWVLSGVGAFPVERGAGDREAIRTSREILRNGECLIMFPEGTRSRSGRLRPFFSGAGVLALEDGVTVIPAAIWGSQRKLGPVRVTFGEPIDMSDIPAGAKSVRAKEAVRRIQEAICELIPVVGGPPQVIPEGEPSLEKY
jgi:1-acyl-sn-glycerol-3-phosphate acyltransferase